MNDIEINLSVNVDHFKEIYFSNGQGHLLKSSMTKAPVVATMLCILIVFVAYVLSMLSYKFGWLLVLSSIITVVVFTNMIIAVTKFMKWKLAVTQYLNKVAKYKFCSIYIAENMFTLKIDETLYMEKWSEIRSGIVTSNYVSFTGASGETYQFPAKSMTAEEYKIFQEFITKNIK